MKIAWNDLDRFAKAMSTKTPAYAKNPAYELLQLPEDEHGGSLSGFTHEMTTDLESLLYGIGIQFTKTHVLLNENELSQSRSDFSIVERIKAGLMLANISIRLHDCTAEDDMVQCLNEGISDQMTAEDFSGGYPEMVLDMVLDYLFIKGLVPDYVNMADEGQPADWQRIN